VAGSMEGITPTYPLPPGRKIFPSGVACALEPQLPLATPTPRLPTLATSPKDLESSKLQKYIDTIQAFITSSRPLNKETSA
jgi:hypothetical protein